MNPCNHSLKQQMCLVLIRMFFRHLPHISCLNLDNIDILIGMQQQQSWILMILILAQSAQQQSTSASS